MQDMASTLLFIGALANIVIAVLRFLSIREILDNSKPPVFGADVRRSSLVIVSLRGAFLHGLFAAITFGFPQELMATRFGSLVGVGVGGYLALVAIENIRLPELNKFGLPLVAPVGALAYFCAYTFV